MFKCGGNTYKSKTDEEMEEIKEKIRITKLGAKNPNATAVKCKNVDTGEEHHFGSVSEMQKFFNTTNHVCLTRRCAHIIYTLYKGVWNIAYEDDDYATDMRRVAPNNKPVKVHVKDLDTREEGTFDSYADAERYFGVKIGSFSCGAGRHKGENTFIIKKSYEITKLGN